MKLSDIHIGDILILNQLNNSGELYYVITDTETVLIGSSSPLKVIFNLKSHYIGISEDIINNELVKLCVESVSYISLALNDFHKDEFPCPYHVSEKYKASVIHHVDMPLLINILAKSEWFERALNKDIKNYGQCIYDLMKEALKEKELL